MANRLERVADITVIPGTPGFPAVPQRCVSVQVGTRRVAVPVTEILVQSPTFEQYTPVDRVGGSIDYSTTRRIYEPIPVPATNVRTGYLFRNVPVYERTCTGGAPAIPGTPYRLEVDDGPDWLAYARSIRSIQDSGVFTGTLVAPAIVGLMAPANPPFSLGVVTYGAYYDGSQLYRVVNGVVGTLLGSFTGDLPFRLERQEGRHTLWIDGAQEDTINLGQTQPAALAAFLETDAGAVDDPQLQEYTTVAGAAAGPLGLPGTVAIAEALLADTSLSLGSYALARVNGEELVLAEARVGLSGTAAATATQDASPTAVLGLAGTASGTADGAWFRTQSPEVVASFGRYASVQLEPSKPELTAASTGGAPTIPFAGADLVTNKPQGATYMITGQVANAALTPARLDITTSETDYAAAELVPEYPRILGYLVTGEPTEVTFTERVFVLPSEQASRSINLTLELGTLTADDELDVTLLAVGDLDLALTLQDEVSLTRAVQQAVAEGLTIRATAPGEPALVDTQYVVTLANGALSRAVGMDFNQFTYGAGHAYGVRPDGLYLIGAGDAELDCEVDFGDFGMGTSRKKNFEAVFIGAGTDGTVYLALTADGKERVYRVVQRADTMRAKVGKGVTARTWGVKLVLTDVTRADIEDVEFVVGTTRRWSR